MTPCYLVDNIGIKKIREGVIIFPPDDVMEAFLYGYIKKLPSVENMVDLQVCKVMEN